MFGLAATKHQMTLRANKWLHNLALNTLNSTTQQVQFYYRVLQCYLQLVEEEKNTPKNHFLLIKVDSLSPSDLVPGLSHLKK